MRPNFVYTSSLTRSRLVLYTQYIKKRNRYIFADNLSNIKDIHFKVAGYIDLYVCHLLAEFHKFPGTVTPYFFSSNKGTHIKKVANNMQLANIASLIYRQPMSTHFL